MVGASLFLIQVEGKGISRGQLEVWFRFSAHVPYSFFYLFFLIYFFKFYFIFKLYIIVLVLPNIKMNPP